MNGLIKHIIEGKTEGTDKRRRSKELDGELKETRGHWKLKENAIDRNLWRTLFGRGYGPAVRETT
jgi:hypothetical protein